MILTKSKGSFIVGFAVIVASQFVGRSRFVQISLLLLTLSLGGAAIKSLPRMEQLQNARQDEAIMGRLMAWELARTVTEEQPNGEGWRSFKAIIVWEGEEQWKATHSSFVLVGAELGKVGMFFYVGVLYCGLRALLLAKCRREEDERSRRVLMMLLIGYILSGWMIDRAYHSEFFLMIGAISALHRRLGVRAGALSESDTEDEEEDDDYGHVEPDFREPHTAGAPVLAGGGFAYASTASATAMASDDAVVSTRGSSPDLDLQEVLAPPPAPKRPTRGTGEAVVHGLSDVDISGVVEEAIEEEIGRMRFWRRFGFLDLLLCLGLTWLVFWTWDYILLNL